MFSSVFYACSCGPLAELVHHRTLVMAAVAGASRTLRLPGSASCAGRLVDGSCTDLHVIFRHRVAGSGTEHEALVIDESRPRVKVWFLHDREEVWVQVTC